MVAFDLFADWDSKHLLSQLESERSAVTQLDSFSNILDFAEPGQPDFGIVCGGIENRLRLVKALESRITLLCTRSENLARLRDTVSVMQNLANHFQDDDFIQIATTVEELAEENDQQKWLRKKLGSSGGFGVEVASQESFDNTNKDDFYFQNRISGTSFSALFVSSLDQTTSILGVTEQLVGQKKFGAQPFRYSGSIGPLPNLLTTRQLESTVRLAKYLASEFGIVGVWGADFILNEKGIWPIDINPRITASAELYEAAMRAETEFASVIALHVDSFASDTKLCEAPGKACSPSQSFKPLTATSIEGKAILFNDSERGYEITPNHADAMIAIHDVGFFGSAKPGFSLADIPNPGVTIQPGYPICTLRSRAGSRDEVESTLDDHAARIFDLLRQ